MRAFAVGLLCFALLPDFAAAQSPSELIGRVEQIVRESGRPRPNDEYLGRLSDGRSQLTGAEVRRLQSALRTLGYYVGPIDGSTGTGTWKAVAKWANKRGWKSPSSLRIEHLESLEAEAAQGKTTSGQEASLPGSDVQRVQSALALLGYYSGPVTGLADAATVQAITAWATDRGWKAPSKIRAAHADSMEKEIAERGLSRPALATQEAATVKRTQMALAQLGYYSGPADGQPGPAVMTAIGAWARDRGWTAPSSVREAHAIHMERELAERGDPAAAATVAGALWAPDGNGSSSKVCARTAYGETCAHLMCLPETGLAFDFDNSSGDDARRTVVKFAVPGGGPTAILPFEGLPKRVALTTADGMKLAARLAGQKVVTVQIAENAQLFSLNGFGSEYRRMSSGCEALLARLDSGEDPYDGRYARLPNELTDPAQGSEPNFTLLANKDLAGLDLRSGLTDPLLRGLGEGDCMDICREAAGCRAFTFNPDGGTCFLKSGKGRETAFPGAKSGVLETPSTAALPPTRGPGPVVNGIVGWRVGDTLAAMQTRIRQAARPLGGSCEAERAMLRNLTDGMRWSFDPSADARVGTALRLRWSNNRLVERIPVWLAIAADGPVRFTGKGHVALGPDAPNPFGLKTGLKQTRALVALATRGAGADGDVEFSPLLAGRLGMSVSLVAYLRACEEEIVLQSESRDFNVAPARAEIVLNTAEGRAVFTRRIDMPAVSRRILLNDTRFLLLDAASGTEIIERAGTDIQISPTHRFLAVDSNGRTDIVDMVDGRTAATVNAGDLHWGLGDSVVFTSRTPWGKVDMASTFGDHLRVLDQLTGPACCFAEPGTTRVAVDIENATYAIWGSQGYRVGSLQNPAFASIANSGGGYSSEGGETIPLHLQTFASFGMVSPVAVGPHFDVAGGFARTDVSDNRIPNEVEEAAIHRTQDRLQRVLATVGLTASKDDEPISGDVRLAEGSNSVPLIRSLPEQFLRLGISLDPMATGEQLLEPEPTGEADHTHSSERTIRLERSAAAMQRFEKEAKGAGWRFAWSLPEEDDGPLGDCYHLLFDKAENKSTLLAPRDVVEVERVATRRGAAWVARASCTAGATLGSLRPFAAFYVMDLGARAPKDADALMLEGSFFFENNARRLWYEHPFRIKANDERLLIFAPGNGVITVHDRATRTTLWVGENLPNGDLLVDAWLTSDRRHAVQVNSDGNFYVHEVKNGGGIVLSGRITDDEVAVWTVDYFYDATAEAAALIDLRFPGRPEQYSLDRFGAARWVVGLARAVLERDELPKAVAEIGVPPGLSGNVELGEDGRVRAALSFDAAQVSRLAVLQDGVVTDTTAPPNDGVLFFERLKDARWVSIIASDATGLASLPVTADLGAPPARHAATRVLAVGINTYGTGGLRSLNYPLRDAGRVLETLGAASGTEPPFTIETGPKDRRADPEAIVAATERLLDGLKAGDHAVLFLAGHGLQDDAGRFYLATSRTDPANLAGTALPFERLARLFEKSEARITILLDACHSGSAGTGAFATNDDLANSLATLRSNITVLAAAKGRQESQGAREFGGLFTDAIVTVLGSERARYDRNNNGRIEASELYRGVKDRVVKASKGQQTPWIIGSRMAGDYALF